MALNVILNIESVRFPLTGIGRYTHELAKSLQAVEDIESLRFFASGRFVPELAYSESESQPESDAVPAAAQSRSLGLRRLVQKSPLALEVYRQLATLLRSSGLKGEESCIYHGPNFFLPRFGGPSVATFHDLSPFTWSHCHEPAKVRYMQKELRLTLDRADRLITDSEFTRHELAAFSGLSLDRIDAVSLACGAEFHPRSETELQPFLARHDLNYQGYTLFVGTIEPRKNILALLQAYESLPLTLRRRWPLVLAGYEGWASDDIHARMQQAEKAGWARYLGFLRAEDLPSLYSGARLFAFPSHYEGFGLPVLEAMSSGVPVVCSNSSSLPEVVGEAALMCDAEDVDTLTAHLITGLEDADWRGAAVQLGLERAAGFSWQRCAEETTNVYRKLLAL